MIVELGFLPVLLNVCANHSPVALTMQNCFSALANLAYNGRRGAAEGEEELTDDKTDRNRDLIVAQGFLPHIQAALTQHSENAIIVEKATLLLYLICNNGNAVASHFC